jgi:hypothetical protein
MAAVQTGQKVRCRVEIVSLSCRQHEPNR